MNISQHNVWRMTICHFISLIYLYFYQTKICVISLTFGKIKSLVERNYRETTYLMARLSKSGAVIMMRKIVYFSIVWIYIEIWRFTYLTKFYERDSEIPQNWGSTLYIYIEIWSSMKNEAINILVSCYTLRIVGVYG